MQDSHNGERDGLLRRIFRLIKQVSVQVCFDRTLQVTSRHQHTCHWKKSDKFSITFCFFASHLKKFTLLILTFDWQLRNTVKGLLIPKLNLTIEFCATMRNCIQKISLRLSLEVPHTVTVLVSSVKSFFCDPKFRYSTSTHPGNSERLGCAGVSP